MEELDFIDMLAERLGSREAAEAASRAFANVVLEEVAGGGRVVISGFGAFDASGHEGLGHLRFRPGTRFRAAVMDGADALRPKAEPSASMARKSRRQSGTEILRRRVVRGPETVTARERGALTFRHYEVPLGVSLSAVLPETSPRCGIYVLHFENGYRYVGQALDVLSRFGSHRRRWPRQLIGLDFAPAAPGNLDDLERRTIQELEKGSTRLYNSALVGLPMGENPLDVVIDRVEQERWLDGATDADDYDFADRIAAAARRSSSSSKLDELRSRADYQDLRFALLLYLVTVVPWPHETERRFWSMTSMPSTNRSRTQRRLATISVNNVEALVVAEVLDGDEWLAGGFLNVSPGLVRRSTTKEWPAKRSG